MKRITLLAILILALLPIGIKAQDSFIGVAGVGAAFEGGGTLSGFAGFDYVLRLDTATGARTYSRVVGQFTDRDNGEEDEGVSIWLMTERKFWGPVYFAIGGGYLRQIKEGPDEQAAGLKFEISWAPIEQAALIVGIDHYPDAGEYSKNVNFIYFGINLLR